MRNIVLILLLNVTGFFCCCPPSIEAASASATIHQAKENLDVSISTQNRISSELESLKQTDTASPELINLYRIYLQRVQAMVLENQKILEQMESAQLQYTASDRPAANSYQYPTNASKTYDSNLPSPQAYDDVAKLDKELGQSLSEFDEVLLKEQTELSERLEQIREQAAGRLNDLALDAAAAANEIREQEEKSVKAETSQGQKSGERQDPTDEDPLEKDAKESSPEYDEKQKRQKRKAGDKGKPHTDPSKTGTTADSDETDYDDDIVARQLREAAEKETDPELKKKLWQEYEAYKRGNG